MVNSSDASFRVAAEAFQPCVARMVTSCNLFNNNRYLYGNDMDDRSDARPLHAEQTAQSGQNFAFRSSEPQGLQINLLVLYFGKELTHIFFDSKRKFHGSFSGKRSKQAEDIIFMLFQIFRINMFSLSFLLPEINPSHHLKWNDMTCF